MPALMLTLALAAPPAGFESPEYVDALRHCPQSQWDAAFKRSSSVPTLTYRQLLRTREKTVVFVVGETNLMKMIVWLDDHPGWGIANIERSEIPAGYFLDADWAIANGRWINRAEVKRVR